MRRLIDYIREECATPSNTMGMGNPAPPTDSMDGTEPIHNKGYVKKEKKHTSKRKAYNK